MTLDVQQRLAGDITNLFPLPRSDANVVRVGAKPLHVVERAGRIDRGPRIPQLAILVQFLLEAAVHSSSFDQRTDHGDPELCRMMFLVVPMTKTHKCAM